MATTERQLKELYEYAANTEQARAELVSRHPWLLSAAVLDSFAEDVTRTRGDTRHALEAAVAELRRLRATVIDTPYKYPLGLGQIEMLWRTYEQGLISLEQAVALARANVTPGELSAPYILALSYACGRDAVLSQQGARSLARQRITRAAIERLEQPFDGHELLGHVTSEWIEICTALLIDVADGRVYREAIALGEEILPRAQQRDPELAALTLLRLGVMNLDPYYAARPHTSYEAHVGAWMRGFADDHAAELAHVPRDQWAMPTPSEAGRRAEQYLSRAVEIASGELLARAVKALAEAYEFRRGVLNEPIDNEKLQRTAERALALLDREQHPHQWLAVLAIMANRTPPMPVPVSEVLAIFRPSDELLLERFPEQRFLELVKLAVRLLVVASPRDGLLLVDRFRDLIRRRAREDDRIEFFRHELLMTLRVEGLEYPERAATDAAQSAAADAHRRAEQEHWPAQRLAVALLAVAQRSIEWDQEPVGEALFDEALTLAPQLAEAHREPLTYVRSMLALGQAVNQYHAGHWAQAIEHYAAALRGVLSLGLSDYTWRLLDRIADLGTATSPGIAYATVREIAPLTLKLNALLGDKAVRVTQRLAERAMLALVGAPGSEEALNFLMQIAKGHRFAATLDRDAPIDVVGDAEARERLDLVQGLYEAMPDDGEDADESPIDEQVLLTAYVSKNPIHSGSTRAELLENAEQAFDARVSALLLENRTRDELRYLPCDEIRTRLDARSALLNVYVAPLPEGRTIVHAVLFTREYVRAGSASWGDVPFDDDAIEAQAHPAAGLVAALRTAIDPPHRRDPITATIDAHLAMCAPLFLGPAVGWLDDLAARGKDHLCIVPHGPLHFCPFHLLIVDGKRLGVRFVVSYLPSLHLLGRDTPGGPRDCAAAVLGVGDQQDMVDEAAAVAASVAARPLLQEQATRGAALQALTRARCVHISAHGAHNVGAPAFQSIEFATTEQDDGRLFAFDVTALDLRGLELLTLSACETALGRFDAGDNLRGMPAAFLGAGTAALIGTLWPAEVNASEHFFVELYAALAGGDTLLDAFARAQSSTRKRFRELRDWGPFYLMGQWGAVAPLRAVS